MNESSPGFVIVTLLELHLVFSEYFETLTVGNEEILQLLITIFSPKVSWFWWLVTKKKNLSISFLVAWIMWCKRNCFDIYELNYKVVKTNYQSNKFL